jgi:hypothetical protein
VERPLVVTAGMLRTVLAATGLAVHEVRQDPVDPAVFRVRMRPEHGHALPAQAVLAAYGLTTLVNAHEVRLNTDPPRPAVERRRRLR